MSLQEQKTKEYSASFYDKTTAVGSPLFVYLGLLSNGLSVRFEDGVRPDEFWPMDDVFSGQPGQGEAICIGNKKQLSVRIYAAQNFMDVVALAIKGEPYVLPSRIRIPAGTIILFSFFLICAIIAYFMADYAA